MTEEEFFKEWNIKFRNIIEKNLVKSLFSCTPKEQEFLKNAILIGAIDNAIEHDPYNYQLELIFSLNGETLRFYKSFDARGFEFVYSFSPFIPYSVQDSEIEKEKFLQIVTLFDSKQMMKDWNYLFQKQNIFLKNADKHNLSYFQTEINGKQYFSFIMDGDFEDYIQNLDHEEKENSIVVEGVKYSTLWLEYNGDEEYCMLVEKS